LRPQSHEIIRTWAYYTLFKSLMHFNAIPWTEVAISGWGIAGEGMGKISKSRGGGPVAPLEMIRRHSADAVRYWAASTGLGKDAIISEERIQAGARLATKLWNVARFSERFIPEDPGLISLGQEGTPRAAQPTGLSADSLPFTPADRWMLARAQRLVTKVTEQMEEHDYAAAKGEIESFFWSEFADNYLEMAKQRLYAASGPRQDAPRYTLFHTLLATIQLLAPFLPYITEAIYLDLFAANRLVSPDASGSIHLSRWPAADSRFDDEQAEAAGEALVAVASSIRRYKSERNLPLSHELAALHVAWLTPKLAAALAGAEDDLKSVTRARTVAFKTSLDTGLETVLVNQIARIGIQP
jgi:valyl-tRNA synthetase